MDNNQRGNLEAWLEQFDKYDTKYYEGDIVVSQSQRKLKEILPDLDHNNIDVIKEFIRQYPTR